VTANLNEKTKEWEVEIDISRRLRQPPERFTSKQDAEAFGLALAKEWID
jgi:hypothetical protein